MTLRTQLQRVPDRRIEDWLREPGWRSEKYAQGALVGDRVVQSHATPCRPQEPVFRELAVSCFPAHQEFADGLAQRQLIAGEIRPTIALPAPANQS